MPKERVLSSILAGAMVLTMTGCTSKTKNNRENEDTIQEEQIEEVYNENDVLVFDAKDQEIFYDLDLDSFNLMKELNRFHLLAPKDGVLANYKDILDDTTEVNIDPSFESTAYSKSFSIYFNFTYRCPIGEDKNNYYCYHADDKTLTSLANFLKKYGLEEFIKKDGNYKESDIQKIFTYINSPAFNPEKSYNINDLIVITTNDSKFSNKYCLLEKDNYPDLLSSYLKKIVGLNENIEGKDGYIDIIHDENYYLIGTEDIIKVYLNWLFHSLECETTTYGLNDKEFRVYPLAEFLASNNLGDLIKDQYSKEEIENIYNILNQQLELTRD